MRFGILIAGICFLLMCACNNNIRDEEYSIKNDSMVKPFLVEGTSFSLQDYDRRKGYLVISDSASAHNSNQLFARLDSVAKQEGYEIFQKVDSCKNYCRLSYAYPAAKGIDIVKVFQYKGLIYLEFYVNF